MRYFCGRQTSDTSNTASSSDARNLNFELLCLRSIPSFSSPFSPLLSPTCASLKRFCFFKKTRSCFLILYLYLSASSKRSCFFSLYCMNRVLFVKYPHFIEKGLASQFCTSLKRSSFSSMHN